MIPRNLKKLIIAAVLVAAATPALAADRKIMLSIDETMKRLDFAERLKENSIEFYWADQVPSRAIEKEMLADTFSRGANAFLKSDVRACTNAFENTADTLVEEARAMGANAVIGIRSYHDELPDVSSETEYRCDVGAFRAAVGFRVRFVRLAP